MKKDFTKDNPALKFINTDPEGAEEPKATTQQEPEEAPEEIQRVILTEKPPKGYKINPAFIETRSKKFYTLMQPSVFKRLDKAAKRKKLSRNEIINIAIIEYLEREGL